MNIISHYGQITPYITQDGSEIRELMHPDKQGNQQQSLAQAIVRPAEITLLHKHHMSEELYFITQGEGQMQLNDELLLVSTGDCICIPPGTPHRIENTGQQNLIFLCCCSPPYSHLDTELINT